MNKSEFNKLFVIQSLKQFFLTAERNIMKIEECDFNYPRFLHYVVFNMKQTFPFEHDISCLVSELEQMHSKMIKKNNVREILDQNHKFEVFQVGFDTILISLLFSQREQSQDKILELMKQINFFAKNSLGKKNSKG